MELTPQQSRTAEARKAFDAKFSSPEERSQYFADLARKRRGSITLSREEQAALGEAYLLLQRVAERVAANGGAR